MKKFLEKHWLAFLLTVAIVSIAATGTIIPYTQFTLKFLQSLDAGTARSLLGVSTTAANITNQLLVTPTVTSGTLSGDFQLNSAALSNGDFYGTRLNASLFGGTITNSIILGGTSSGVAATNMTNYNGLWNGGVLLSPTNINMISTNSTNFGGLYQGGIFFGNGAGLTNIFTGSFTNGLNYYIDAIAGQPTNSGLNPRHPLDSITTLQTKNYYGAVLNFQGGFGQVYYVSNPPLVLSNNFVDLKGATISGQINDAAASGVVEMVGSGTLLNGTITAISTNGTEYPLFFNWALSPSNSSEVVQNMIFDGISDGIGNNGIAGCSNRVNLLCSDNFAVSGWDTYTFNSNLTGDATNSIIVCNNDTALINPALWPAPSPYTNVLNLATQDHGFYFWGGNDFVNGGSVSILNAPAGSTIWGLENASSVTEGHLTISGTTLNLQTNLGPANVYSVFQNSVTGSGKAITVIGHPFPDNSYGIAVRAKFIAFQGDQTNLPSTTLPNIMFSDGTNRYWVTLTNQPAKNTTLEFDGTNYYMTPSLGSTYSYSASISANYWTNTTPGEVVVYLTGGNSITNTDAAGNPQMIFGGTIVGGNLFTLIVQPGGYLSGVSLVGIAHSF
jgi:hypothetical protein